MGVDKQNSGFGTARLHPELWCVARSARRLESLCGYPETPRWTEVIRADACTFLISKSHRYLQAGRGTSTCERVFDPWEHESFASHRPLACYPLSLPSCWPRCTYLFLLTKSTQSMYSSSWTRHGNNSAQKKVTVMCGAVRAGTGTKPTGSPHEVSDTCKVRWPIRQGPRRRAQDWGAVASKT